MEKIDVIVQSYRKPESLIYTLLSLKKYCGEHIDTIYIDDDQSNDGTTDLYNEKLIKKMEPIKILVRVNQKKSGYTHTCMTWKTFKKKTFFEKMQLFSYFFINRIKFYKTSDDIRYQWGINHTNKKYVFIQKEKSIREALPFYLSRLSTLLLDMLLMFILVTKLNMYDKICKLIVQIIIIILNYILSKLLVFKKTRF